MTKADKKEIALCRQLIRILRKGYGKPCKTKDYEDFKKHPRELNAQGRCGCCAANEVILWLEGHIELIKM
jgi:hypothetical protein